jgi:lysozyme family protein
VNSGAWPQDFAFINSLPQDQRATAVQAFYYKHFWNSYVAQVSSDDVAKRWLDMAVNGGEGTSTKLLQQAVNSFHVGNPLNIDGRLGPATVVVVNAVNPLTLVAAFQNQRVAYYETVAAKNPADAKYLPAWLARARK